MKNISSLLFIILIISHSSLLNAEEMIIGEETIEPGINIIFEGAIKDSITPKEFYLSEKNLDIHIEALITWSKDGPEGSIEGGFVPYLEISVKIKNQNNCMIIF